MITINGHTYLEGSGVYPWRAEIVGEDLVIGNARVTCFGGDSDPGDNGETASGVLTRGHPTLRGCALPTGRVRATSGSPIPRLRWNTPIIFVRGAQRITVPLIDEGPARVDFGGAPHAAGDLTRQAMLDLGGDPGTHMTGDLTGVTIIIPNYKQHLA